MKKKRLRYIISEIKTIAIFAFIPSAYIFFGSAAWWWFEPYITGLLMFAVPFAIFAVIGVLGSLHDDYRIVIERRHGR